MTNPRKPVHTADDAQAKAVRYAVHRHLLAATEAGSRAIGATGASFVIIGVGIWTSELAELDARATAKFLRALADHVDPASNDGRKRRAEKDRAQAVRAILAALDLTMAEAKGNG